MAHIIMAYKDPPQLERLVKRMSHENFDFYIHVDTKFDLQPFEYLAKIDRVYLIKNRIKIRWAGFSFTMGVLNSIKEIFSTGRQYDFISSMSGQDYPLVSAQYFHDFFDDQKGRNFLAIEEFGSPWWKQAEIRINQYHFTDFDFKGRYRVQYLVNKILPKRKFPRGYTLFGSNRATWWTMSTECAAYVIDFLRENPEFCKFAKFTWAPDEFLLPTIIMNSRFKTTVDPENYRYIDWSLGGANPKILTVNDFEALKKTNKLLARKFDIKVDSKILDLIDGIST